METTPASWVSELARRPIAFAQVREDALLDRWVTDQLGEKVEVLMVASGGCTAAALAASPRISRLNLVDPNPAQIALSRLKLRLLATATTAERLAILGHAAMPIDERERRLARELASLGLPMDAMGPLALLAEIGPDYAGRYEGLFAKLREPLGAWVNELKDLLQLRNPAEQSLRIVPATRLGQVLDKAFDSVMALPNLIGLFGEAATRNRCEPFSRHFARRTRHALASLTAADNPYLWQLLLGRFPKDVAYPWLNAATPGRLPKVEWTVALMADALKSQTESFNFIHLSNILDWLTPEEAQTTFDLARKALRSGGVILVRQLNSSLDIPALGEGFKWDGKTADSLHNQDRSFFYRRLHLGRKQ